MAPAQKQFSDPDLGAMPNVNATGLNQGVSGRTVQPGAQQYYSGLNAAAPVAPAKVAKPTKAIPQPKTPRAQKVIQQLTKPKPSQKRGTSTGYMAGGAGATLNNAASTAPTALQ